MRTHRRRCARSSARADAKGTSDFTNVLKKSQIERLAEADEHELVREVQVRVRIE